MTMNDMTGSAVNCHMKRGAQSLGALLERSPASTWAFFAWVGAMAFKFLGLCKQSYMGANRT